MKRRSWYILSNKMYFKRAGKKIHEGTNVENNSLIINGMLSGAGTWRCRLWPRPHVSGYFWIRNFFFPDTAIVHTHTAQFLNPITFRIRVDGRIQIFSDTMSSQYLPRKFKRGRWSKANSFCALWAYFQSFSLYAAKCRSTKCWNKLCQKAAWRLQALYVIYRTKRPAETT